MGAGREFLERTSFKNQTQSDQAKGLPMPPFEDPVEGEPIILPDPDSLDLKQIDISEAIELRESIREYREDPITLSELSYLLWCTQGVKWTFPEATFRTVPSAGARHPMDTYLLVNRVGELESGIYKYLAFDHALLAIPSNQFIDDLVTTACHEQAYVKKSAVTFIWVATPYRMTWRYGERGYRDIFLEAGHICQNLYLSALSVDCGVCAIGAFNDGEINDLLGLDGEEKFVIYMATLGKRYHVIDDETE